MDPSEVTYDVIDNIMPDLLARYPNVEFKLQGNSKEQADAMFSFMQGLLFALFAIYTLLAIPLRSYSQKKLLLKLIALRMIKFSYY